MENRLCLNSRPIYELPNEIEIGLYMKQRGRSLIEPNFEPDICINAFGSRCVAEKKSFMHQIWIKTSNDKLIRFVKEYKFNKINSLTKDNLPLWKVKKIILEEFYNKKGCDIDEENYR